MKSRLFLSMILGAAMTFSLQAQEKRASPMANVKQSIGNADVSITYSRPSKKGREIFGDLVPYDQVWRTGANEATVLKTSAPILVEGEELPAGQYALFTIPGKDEWTIILNSHYQQWGAYSYDADKDIMRFTVETQEIDTEETFTIDITENGMVQISWDTTMVEFELEDAE